MLIADFVRHVGLSLGQRVLLGLADAGHRILFRRSREDEIQMDAFDVLAAERAEPRRHRGADVTALREVAWVTELIHQFHEQFCAGARLEAWLARRARKPVTRNRRTDHVKCVAPVAAEAFGLRERFDHLHELADRSGPAVRDQQWLRVRLVER